MKEQLCIFHLDLLAAACTSGSPLLILVGTGWDFAFSSVEKLVSLCFPLHLKQRY